MLSITHQRIDGVLTAVITMSSNFVSVLPASEEIRFIMKWRTASVRNRITIKTDPYKISALNSSVSISDILVIFLIQTYLITIHANYKIPFSNKVCCVFSAPWRIHRWWISCSYNETKIRSSIYQQMYYP